MADARTFTTTFLTALSFFPARFLEDATVRSTTFFFAATFALIADTARAACFFTAVTFLIVLVAFPTFFTVPFRVALLGFVLTGFFRAADFAAAFFTGFDFVAFLLLLRCAMIGVLRKLCVRSVCELPLFIVDRTRLSGSRHGAARRIHFPPHVRNFRSASESFTLK